MKPHKSKPGELTRSSRFVYRVAITRDGTTTVYLKTGDVEEAKRLFETLSETEREKRLGGLVSLDKFLVEERETWSMRVYQSKPPKPAARVSGKQRILFVPLEMPSWLHARGWSYCANMAFVPALKALGHDVTVLNSISIRYRDLVKGSFDQVWTNVHFRHATDHYYREWFQDLAPIRLGLAGESVFYSTEEELANPWYAGQTKAFQDLKPFLTHCAFAAAPDADKAREPGLRTMPWHQAVPERMVMDVRKRSIDRAIFCGNAYPPRDAWIWNPALRELLAMVKDPEGLSIRRKFNWPHSAVGFWVEKIGSFQELALSVYHARIGQLRARAERDFIRAIGQGVAVVNLPSMIHGFSCRVVEGMASGRPVLTWKPAAVPGLFGDDELVLYDDSPEALAEAIERLKGDEPRARRIAANARKLLLAKHTTLTRARELVEFASS